MESKKFKVIIVEDVKLELKGTEEIFRHEIPNAEVIGTAMTENEFWELLKVHTPDMVLLDLGLGGSMRVRPKRACATAGSSPARCRTAWRVCASTEVTR